MFGAEVKFCLYIYYSRINLQDEHETNMRQTIGSEREGACLFASSPVEVNFTSVW